MKNDSNDHMQAWKNPKPLCLSSTSLVLCVKVFGFIVAVLCGLESCNFHRFALQGGPLLAILGISFKKLLCYH